VAEPADVGDQIADAATKFLNDTAEAFAWQVVTAIATGHGLRPLVMAVDCSRRALSVLSALDSTSGVEFDVPLPFGPDDLMVSMRVDGDPDDTTWPVSWYVEQADGSLLSAVEVGAAGHDDARAPGDGWPTVTGRQREALEKAQPGRGGERLVPVLDRDTAIYVLDLRFVDGEGPGPATPDQLRHYASTLWHKDLSGGRGREQVDKIVFCNPDHSIYVLIPVSVLTD
jgi:hypothetical protein